MVFKMIDEQLIKPVTPIAPLGIIAHESAENLGHKIDKHLRTWYQDDPDPRNNRSTFLMNASCARFSTGDGKAIIYETVRGYDLYLIVDVGNYSRRYKLFGQEVPMSPDDNFQDLKRIISAAGGKATRLNVIMPILYGGRQHRRNYRESLDCSMALLELERMGVKNLITFDAHDSRVQNAIPLMGFDNVFPTYQVLKALTRNIDDMRIDKDNMMVVSPDEGAISRNLYYSSVMGLELGMFYKRRDYSVIVDGRNPIVAHEYLGSDVNGKDIFITDDVIATGESVLDLAVELKKRKANRIFIAATYALFTCGIEEYQRAYEEGIITRVLSTNLTYQSESLLNAPWYISVDMSKYLAYLITALNTNSSITTLLDPHEKISKLLDQYNS